MTRRLARPLLAIDAVVNLALGLLLLTFPAPLVAALGIPPTDVVFYPSVLGAVLLGIGIALCLECAHPSKGLGLGGAVAINTCGAVAVALWLLSGRLDLPLRGQVILWSIVAIVAGLGVIEAAIQIASRGKR